MSYTIQGNEILFAQGQQANGQPSATLIPLTTAQIASLASTESTGVVETVISTVGNGTLTAAALVGGQIIRSGPTGAYTDTTDSAGNITLAMPEFLSGSQFDVVLKNSTIYPQTIAAGGNVTLPATVLVPPLCESKYFVTMGGTAAAPTATFTHVGTSPIHTSNSVSSPLATNLNTVGNGTISALGIAGGVTVRGGTQTGVFTDTTDTGANITAQLSAGSSILGQAAFYTYVNDTVYPATITGGANVTVSGITTVPANSWAEYLTTNPTAGNITLQGIEQGYFPSSGTFTNNDTSAVTTANTAVTANSNIIITLKTVGGTVGAIPHVETITPGTGFTTVGTASDTSVYNYTILG